MLDRDLDKIWNKYATKALISDLIACIPVDYLGMGIGLSRYTRAWLRLLRLLKVYRVI